MIGAPDNKQLIRAIVISSVQPEPTMAGQIKLYRHVVENTEVQLVTYLAERRLLARKSFRQRLIARLERTRLSRWLADGELLQFGRWLDKGLPSPPDDGIASVVVTVAHGSGCWAARRYAQNHRLPLVTFFDDWWPDIPDVHAPFRRLLEKEFRDLYHVSTVALCVCERMKTTLGDHPCAPVLYPIAQKSNGNRAIALPPANSIAPFKLFYFGNLFEYGSMLGEALRMLCEQNSIHFEVRGANPNWSANFRESMRSRGLWKDFAPRNELDAWLAEADALLVPMVFDTHLRRRMETSFPSKLTEFAQLGKPLVIWGPEYCSAVQWARQEERALCVADPNANALRKALEDLVASPTELLRLAAAARQAARTDFNPERIQAQFMEALRSVVKNTN